MNLELMLTEYMPHGHCFLWQSDILLPYVFGELLTAVSYVSIPTAFFALSKSRVIDDKLKPMIHVYSAFILSCGVGHFLNVYNVWHGRYGVSAIVSTATGFISLIAAAATIYLLKFYWKLDAKKKRLKDD